MNGIFTPGDIMCMYNVLAKKSKYEIMMQIYSKYHCGYKQSYPKSQTQKCKAKGMNNNLQAPALPVWFACQIRQLVHSLYRTDIHGYNMQYGEFLMCMK